MPAFPESPGRLSNASLSPKNSSDVSLHHLRRRQLPGLITEDSESQGDSSSPSPRFRSSRSRHSQAAIDVAKPKMEKIKLFQNCTPCFLEALFHQLENDVFDAGTEIIKQGDYGVYMYLLNFGEVEVLVTEAKIVVATLGSGTMFGEMAAICKDLSAAKRTATIKAKTMCHCWKIDRPLLLKLFATYPRDEAVISAEADRRFQDLIDKGFIKAVEKKHPFRHQQKEVQTALTNRRMSRQTTFDPGQLGASVQHTYTSEGGHSTPKSCGGTPKSCGGHNTLELPDLETPDRSFELPSLGKAIVASAAEECARWQLDSPSKRSYSSWNDGETSHVREARSKAYAFLAERGIMR